MYNPSSYGVLVTGTMSCRHAPSTPQGVNFDTLLQYPTHLALVNVDHSHRLDTGLSFKDVKKGLKKGLKKAARDAKEMAQEMVQYDADSGVQLFLPAKIMRMSDKEVEAFKVAELKEIYKMEFDLLNAPKKPKSWLGDDPKIPVLMQKMRLAHVFIVRKDLAPPPGYTADDFKRYKREKQTLSHQIHG